MVEMMVEMMVVVMVDMKAGWKVATKVVMMADNSVGMLALRMVVKWVELKVAARVWKRVELKVDL